MSPNNKTVCSEKIRNYWSVQAQAFYELSVEEWNSGIHEIWDAILKQHFRLKEGASVLEIGCGSGFMSLILAELGYQVTATDINEDMLSAGKRLAEELHLDERIRFMEMDAQSLDFEDGMFDGVISRNVMWALEEPELAYREWMRVLKKNGVCVVIDANWYLHLYDPEYSKRREEGLLNLRKAGYPIRDERHTKEYDAFVLELPLSRRVRPEWDRELLESGLCSELEIIPELPAELYEKYYQIMYEKNPTFLVRAVK